jgi:hypothetical protein
LEGEFFLGMCSEAKTHCFERCVEEEVEACCGDGVCSKLEQPPGRCPEDCTCGDDVLDPNEECDGSQLGGETCRSLGHGGGALGCTDGCDFDETACYECGDGVAHPPEECDGDDLSGESCESLGYGGGMLACGSDCAFDTSACASCGNGTCDEGEDFETCSDCDHPFTGTYSFQFSASPVCMPQDEEYVYGGSLEIVVSAEGAVTASITSAADGIVSGVFSDELPARQVESDVYGNGQFEVSVSAEDGCKLLGSGGVPYLDHLYVQVVFDSDGALSRGQWACSDICEAPMLE